MSIDIPERVEVGTVEGERREGWSESGERVGMLGKGWRESGGKVEGEWWEGWRESGGKGGGRVVGR